jgi:hypothetical protein
MLPPPEGGPNWVCFGMRPRLQRNFTFWRMNACDAALSHTMAVFPATNSWSPFHAVSAGVTLFLLTRSYQNCSASRFFGWSHKTLVPSAVNASPPLA